MEGFFFDPKHGGRIRQVKSDGHKRWIILGVYGDDERPYTGQLWYAYLYEVTYNKAFLADFIGKKKRRRYLNVMLVDGNLHWSDGNVWEKLPSIT